MRKIISLTHLSLDGMTSGPNDELDWISYDEELEGYAHSMQEKTDAVIWGRKTYEGMAGYWLTVPGNPDSTPAEREHAQWLNDATKIIVSRTLDRIEWGDSQNSVLLRDNLAQEINKIKQQAGKDIWFLGSPNLMQTFMQLDLIDEYRINVNPTILGEGKRMFDNMSRSIPLKLLDSQTLKSGVVLLRYEPVRK
jgi:dihydrofolate reductase